MSNWIEEPYFIKAEQKKAGVKYRKRLIRNAVYYIEPSRDKFRSFQEREFAVYLQEHNFQYGYEIKSFPLMSKFKGQKMSWQAISYTPDFFLIVNGKKVIIEFKGYLREKDRWRLRIFDYLYKDKFIFMIVTKEGANYFLYRNKKSGNIATILHQL